MAFDLRALRYFVRIAELGSLSRAARTLHIAQPALSQQLAGLEDHLGVRLFERSRSGVVLTAEGEQLLSGANELLARASALEGKLSGHGGSVSGSISFGIPGSPALTLLPPLLQRLRTKHPGLRMSVEEGKSAVLFDGLLNGTFDIIISAYQGDTTRMVSTLIAEETLYLAGGPESGLGDTVNYAELKGYPLIQATTAADLRGSVDPALRKIGGDAVNVVMECNSIAANRTMVAETELFMVTAWSTIHADVMTGRLKAAKIVNPEHRRPLYVSYTNDRGYSALIPVVIAEIQAVVKRLVEQGIWC